MPHKKKETLVPKTALELNAVKNSFQMIYCFFLHLFGFKLHNCNDANLVGPQEGMEKAQMFPMLLLDELEN